MSFVELPIPTLVERSSNGTSGEALPFLTDDALFDACGVRIAFTGRAGGVSTGDLASLNLGKTGEDVTENILENRRRVLRAMGAKADFCVLIPNQVHKDKVVEVLTADEAALSAARETCEAGADGIIVACENVAAMLRFADCVPVIIVALSGQFAVVHAGWRGVMARIAPKACTQLAALTGADASTFNIYIGPHIRKECFETSPEIHDEFVQEFGESVSADESHIDLSEALRVSLAEVGADEERIFDAGICTVCNSQRYFSHRASDGRAGRHGAVAFRASGTLAQD